MTTPLPAVLLALVTLATASAQSVIPIDPSRTYLRCSPSDPAPSSTAIPLATAGIAPLQVVRIRRLGDFDNGPGGDIYGTTIALFSADAMLLASSQPARVPGAIEAGCDFVTSPTYFGNLVTDIAEDFLVAAGAGARATQDEVVVVVPAGATHVFVAAHDSHYVDNVDPDGDYAVEFSVLAPTAWSQLGGGIRGSAGIPLLSASGELVCGSRVDFTLTRARPQTPVLHVLGVTRADLPLFGGTLVPQPLIAEGLVATDAAGRALLSLPVPVRFPSGGRLFVQVWLLDPSARFGIAASGAVGGVAP